MPVANSSPECAIVDGKIYVIGGGDPDTDGVYEYDTITDTWTTRTPMPTSRVGHTTVALYEKIYAIGGGVYLTGKILDTVELYDPHTDSWTTGEHLLSPVLSHTSAVVEEKIYVIGGRNGPNNGQYVLDLVEEYSPPKTVKIYSGAADGEVCRVHMTESWDQIRTAEITYNPVGVDCVRGLSLDSWVGLASAPESCTWRNFRRLALPFNTGLILPDDAVVTAATLNLFCYHSMTELGDLHVAVVESGQQSPTNLVNTDYYYQYWGTIDLAYRFKVSDMACFPGHYNSISLNNNGKNLISNTDWTMFGLRTSNDVDNIEPPNPCDDVPRASQLSFYMSETASDNTAPYLEVTYVVSCEGDFEPDGDVDGSDLAVFAADFGRTDCSDDCEGDFDDDDDVDGSDLAVFAADFGRTDCPTP